jgi:hypothetical protein
MRIWIVTARDRESKFIDQRRIESHGQAQAESDAYDWIRRVGGDPITSNIKEVRS